jgi:hypothetical protein
MKGEISFEVSDNLNIQKPAVDQPKLSGGLNVPVLVPIKIKSRFLLRLINLKEK